MIANSAAANTPARARSSDGTSATAPTKHGIATTSSTFARGPQAPMNGGCGTPSCVPDRSSPTPTTTVAIAASAPIHGTRRT